MKTIMSVRCITLGTRPYIESHMICSIIDLKYDTWFQWLMDPDEYSVGMVRTKDGLFVEESAASLIIQRRCIPTINERWKRWITNNQMKRKLTEAEKKAVAAEQMYRCAMCNEIVQHYEIDHIEQQCIRSNHSRMNLQCLCPSCHRRKTIVDRQYGDALFEKSKGFSKMLHGGGGNVFSSYFYTNDM